jgi:hypothetical protein
MPILCASVYFVVDLQSNSFIAVDESWLMTASYSYPHSLSKALSVQAHPVLLDFFQGADDVLKKSQKGSNAKTFSFSFVCLMCVLLTSLPLVMCGGVVGSGNWYPPRNKYHMPLKKS